MSTIILYIEGKNLHEWKERIYTLAASQQANTYFMGFLSKIINKEEWMKIICSIARIIEGIETLKLSPNKEMPDIIDKVEENNSTQLLAATTTQKQEKLVENNVSTAIILKEILSNVHKDIISTIWENEALVYTETTSFHEKE
jgi:hypothetical protein